MSGEAKDMVSVRMPADLVAALRQRAEDGGETVSDVLRRAALLFLGTCPTCERPMDGTAQAAGGERP